MNEEFDSGSVEDIKELMESEGWLLLQDRLFDAIDQKRSEWENTGSSYEVAEYYRGFIKGIRLALSLPGVLKQEAEAWKKEHGDE